MSKSTRTVSALAAALTFGAAALSASAAEEKPAEGRIEIGYLVCELTSDTGNIVLSEQQYACSLDSAEPGRADEVYVAEISKIGIDLSKTDEETIRWAVFAPAEKDEFGRLAGEYAGVSADIALGVGVGGKALVGGFEDSIALQPLSATTQEGIGIALGVENMTLTHVPN